MDQFTKPVRYLKGVGPCLAKVFEKLEIRTLEDLIYFFPRGYQDRTQRRKIDQLKPGEVGLVTGIVKTVKKEIKKGGFTIIRATLTDSSGEIDALWFNQPYMLSYLKRGVELFLVGRVDFNSYRGALEILVREYEKLEGKQEGWEKIVPIYPLTGGLYQKRLRKIIARALNVYLSSLSDYLPANLIREHKFPSLRMAVSTLHSPKDLKLVPESRKRLVFDEFFIFQLGLFLLRKRREQGANGIAYFVEGDLVKEFQSNLPFRLTDSQKRVIGEIKKDLASNRPMSRLLQGEVGSGKTIVALVAALIAVANGYQVAIMAPTEILARQHYVKIKNYLEKFRIDICLLTGGVKTKERRGILREIKEGRAQIVIGTHALIEGNVVFFKLGLVVIDEQHRFGVRQRAFLKEKGKSPDLLVMTATPIPRTLALTLYGDLDRSVISELPPGRLPVKTHYVPDTKRKDAYEFVRKEVQKGQQVFVVCPLIEESEALSVKAVLAEGELLQKQVFPEFKVRVVHGRLKAEEKNEIMRNFKEGKIQILVSTSLVEVGIDVPDATIMLIEHVERFGLSQLHQLRGRIGRGAVQSYCFLFGRVETEEARLRVRALVSSNDGFKIAEADLKIRGPGDFFGVRQAGLPPFRVADIIGDEAILRAAREAAFGLLEKDPKLEQKEHLALKKIIFTKYGKFWGY